MIIVQSGLLKVAPFLRGIGQIMLQNNPWTGLLFLAGICYGSLTMGIAVVISVATGTLTSMLLKYDTDEINSGLYGFSAALVGVALICFFKSTAIIWITLVIGSALASIIQHLFIARKIPAFTFPFILVVWLFLAIVHFYPSLVQTQVLTTNLSINTYTALFSRGFGQVIFQDNIWAGILFMIGVFINRPIDAVYAIAGIALSGILAHQLKEPVNDIYLGLLSYNAVLCAIAFSGKKGENIVLGLVAVILSVLIMVQMRHMSLPALTFPFVLATWLTLVVKMVQKRDPEIA